MSANFTQGKQKKGRDTTYRTQILDTHLTHGCIQLFRHFRSKRFAFALGRLVQIAGISQLFEQANRIRVGGAL